MNLTKTILRNSSTRQSYNRGKNYYASDSVSELIKKGNKYQAVVWGSDEYDVEFVIEHDDIKTVCSCPYNWGGICKHIVAVGLAIIDGAYEVDSNYHYLPEADFFRTVFPNVSTKQKNEFLKKLLKKDEDLRSDFIHFTKSATPSIASTSATKSKQTNQAPPTASKQQTENHEIEIGPLAAEIRGEFEKIEIAEPHHKYSYSDADVWEEANELVTMAMAEHFEELNVYIELKDLNNLVAYLLAIYEATQGVNCVAEQTTDLEIDQLLTDTYSSSLASLTDTLTPLKIKNDIYKNALDLIINRYQEINSNNPLFEDTYHKDVTYDFSDLIPLFVSLSPNKKTAQHLIDSLQKNQLISLKTARLVFYLAEKTNNEILWLQTAENFTHQDFDIAQSLIKKYDILNKKTDLYRIAKTTFKAFPIKSPEFLLEYIQQEDAPNLYYKVLEKYTSYKKSMFGYKRLHYLFPDEITKNNFIEKHQNNKLFYINMLALERRFKDILALVQSIKNSIDDNYKLLSPILKIYPDACIQFIKKHIDQNLKHASDRKTYKQLTNWLLAVHEINQPKKVMALIEHVKTKYAHLPALQDEMKKAGAYHYKVTTTSPSSGTDE